MSTECKHRDTPNCFKITQEPRTCVEDFWRAENGMDQQQPNPLNDDDDDDERC